MAKIQKITAFKLSDGRIYDNEKQAAREQEALDFSRALKALLEKNVEYFDEQDIAFNIITENKDELKELFNLLNPNQ